MMPESQFVVMDSRAQYDTDAASVLEAVGSTQPSWRQLQRDWGNQGAVLVRYFGWDGKAYTKKEIVGVVK